MPGTNDEPPVDDWLEEDEEDLDRFLADWEKVDKEAARILLEALSEQRGREAPATELVAAASALREGLGSDRYPFDWLRAGAGLGADLPEDDAELLLRCVEATISPREDTGLDPEDDASIGSMEHADWLGAVVSAVRAGPGSPARPEDLAQGILLCPEVEPGGGVDPDELELTESTFALVSLPWQLIGLIDGDERLTRLGAWALPRALARAWNSDFDGGEPAAG